MERYFDIVKVADRYSVIGGLLYKIKADGVREVPSLVRRREIL